jgi:hypothetical protein
MITYKITLIGMQMDGSNNPPSIVTSLFPGIEYASIELSTSDCLVTFATPQTPVDLGPLVKVEIVPSL